MSYDPLKALRAAGILECPLPAELEQAINKLTQEEVDLIISHKTHNPSLSAPQTQWTNPKVNPLSGAMGGLESHCYCSTWSGAGTADSK